MSPITGISTRTSSADISTRPCFTTPISTRCSITGISTRTSSPTSWR